MDLKMETSIPPMLKKGGFIPYIDHHVPPDISLENFIYYRKKLQGLIEKHFRG